jgi:citrate synthase
VRENLLYGRPEATRAELEAACRAAHIHERIVELADGRGVSGANIALARAIRDELGMVMNVSMPIAAVMLDLGFPAAAVKAVPILARTAGLLAHLVEEQDHPVGFLLARAAEEAIEYER